jgi:hypothetical protein
MNARSVWMKLLTQAVQLTERAMPPRMRMLKVLTGAWVAQAACVAACLHLPDVVEERPATVKELADRIGADEQALYRLLRALVSVGLFEVDECQRFAVTPTGACLRTNSPESVRPLAQLMSGELYKAWGELQYSVQTGKPAFDRVYQMPLFEYLKNNPDSGEVFDACMASIHGAEAVHVLSSYDFSRFSTIVDVGGGKGSFLLPILKKHAQASGILFELPQVLDRASAAVREAGMESRCRVETGNFFEAVPKGADAYLLRHIIHDWNDEASVTILKNIRKAMLPAGAVIIVESVIPPGNGYFSGKLLDLNMLVVAGGLERTAQQYERLLRTAGFDRVRILPTKILRLSIAEGRPAH